MNIIEYPGEYKGYKYNFEVSAPENKVYLVNNTYIMQPRMFENFKLYVDNLVKPQEFNKEFDKWLESD